MNVICTESEGVLEITLNRPSVNAINMALSRELGDIFARYRETEELRCAIVTGQGERAFSAGWDLKEAALEGADESDDYGVGGFAGLTNVFDLNKPVIAAINGLAIGGGLELTLACDLVVAAEHAYFSLPEASVGVVADAGGVQRLPKRVPLNVAMEMLLTGRKMYMDEAKHYGLANYVVPRKELMLKARELALAIAQGAPLSIQATKQMVREMAKMSEEEAFAATDKGLFSVHQKMLKSEDHVEGPLAFAEKREPVWKGR